MVATTIIGGRNGATAISTKTTYQQLRPDNLAITNSGQFQFIRNRKLLGSLSILDVHTYNEHIFK